MTYSMYSGVFSIVIMVSFMLPAVIAGLSGKSVKWLGMLASIPMIALIMGLHSKQMIQFLMFIVCEIILVFGYYLFHKRSKSELVYFVVMGLSMLPIIIVKLCVYAERYNALGFIGISYISFRVWQMIIEIHDGKIQKISLPDMIYFFVFFPTLTSGPVDRYLRFSEDIKAKRTSKEYIRDFLMPGVKKILMGALYKLIIAALIKTYLLDMIPVEITVVNAIKYMYTYTLYLFFDFAGYSNFAIGTSYILGIKSPENFNKPFLARNMKEFWDRWHISLSRWFTDYVFSRFVLNNIRNGLFKSKKTASRCGYLVSMTLMGLWHGVFVSYFVYGLYQAVMLIISDSHTKSKFFRKYKDSRRYNLLSRIICFNVISFGMLLFSGYLFSF